MSLTLRFSKDQSPLSPDGRWRLDPKDTAGIVQTNYFLRSGGGSPLGKVEDCLGLDGHLLHGAFRIGISGDGTFGDGEIRGGISSRV